MTRVLAVEWDNREVRLVSGSIGGTVTIEHALAHYIPNPTQEIPIVPAIVAPILRELASKAGVSGGDIVVSLGRGQVELRNMLLPKSDPNDLPDMVRFAAAKHFASIGDTWPLDFVCLPKASQQVASKSDEGGETQEVTAVAVNPSTITQIRRICSDAGFNLKQLGLRPMASGTLGTQSPKSPIRKDMSVLLVDVLADEADMVVLEQGHVTFMRTVRLFISDEQPRGILTVGEIRRTLIAAMNARPGLEIERIYLWGRNTLESNAIVQWQQELDLPVEVIDPFDIVDVKKSLESESDSGRFAPLIGMLYQYRPSSKIALSNTAVDFLHPRHRVEKKKPIREYALAAIAATLLLGGGFWWYRSAHLRRDARIAELTAQIDGMKASVDAATKSSKNWRKVEAFMQGDIQWLDELANLSEKALPADEMILRDTNISLLPTTNEGKLTARVDIVDADLQTKIEDNFRDERHKIGSKEVRPGNDRKSKYSWSTDPEIIIAPVTVVDPLTLPPPKLKEPAESQTETPSDQEADTSAEKSAENPPDSNPTSPSVSPEPNTTPTPVEAPRT